MESSSQQNLKLNFELGAGSPPPSALEQSSMMQNMSAKEFVATVCEQSHIAEILPDTMTIQDLSTVSPETFVKMPEQDKNFEANLTFCIEMAKQHLVQNDCAIVSTLPFQLPNRQLSLAASPRSSNVAQNDAGSSALGNVNSSGHQAPSSINSQTLLCNPLARMFLRRTFSENTRRNRNVSCNLGSSTGSTLLKSIGFSSTFRSPGLSHCSLGHELSNIVRLGGAAFGQSAPCLLTSFRDSENNRDFLSASHNGGRLRSSTTRRCSHASGGRLSSVRNDSTASTTTSPMESPKPFAQSGQYSTGFTRLANWHRRWSVASLPGSSGYATEPGGVGSDGASSIYNSNEGLSHAITLTPSHVNSIRQRHHTASLGAQAAPASTLRLSPRPDMLTSAFSSSDSNPVFELQNQLAAELSPTQRPRLARKHSTPSLCSLGDDDVAILNSVYQECFPRAQRIMEDHLRSLIAVEQKNPIAMPESMDGAFCFVHDQALQLAADCLRASELGQLSATHFANLSSNLEQLAKQAKQKCPLSAPKLHKIIVNILMAIARCARLCQILELSPDALKLENQLDTPNVVNQVQGDVYRYVTEQLGEMPAGLDDASLFNTSAIRRTLSGGNNSSTNLQTPKTFSLHRQPKELSTSLASIAAPSEEDFEIAKNISNGAYGAVFLVRQKRTGQRFAMKRINKRCLALHNQCEQLWAERNILTFADNPFVVQMYCSFETPKHFCMVMEYVQGGDLASLLKKVRTVPVDLARVYFAEIVLALAYLHSYGIIHRDIKPDNLLITATGHIKLTDFGLSKIGLMNRTTHMIVSDTGSGMGERLFKDKQVYGTPQYIAPEVILGQDYGKAVDWWSVGVVLYECLLGVTPFYGSSPEEVFHMIVYHDGIEWPDDPNDPLYPTDESRDLIENLLQVDPDIRLGSGGANDVKSHGFFDSVDWQSVLWQKAEMLFVPQLDDEEDTGYFDSRSDRYRHDDTVEDNEAMMQADMVFMPPPSNSPFEGTSPLNRSQVGSVTDSLKSCSNEATLLPPSCDATTLAASTTPPASDIMFQSFCSFSPRYARDSLTLKSSSGESSPLLATSLNTADLEVAKSRISEFFSPEPHKEDDKPKSVPVISVNTEGATPPNSSNILSLAASEAACQLQNRETVKNRSDSSKPLSLVIPPAGSDTQRASSPLSGPHLSTGSEVSSSSLSPLSPGSFVVPGPVCPSSVTIKRGARGFGFTFRTVRTREAFPVATPGHAGKTPNRKSHLQHVILSVQSNSPAATAGLQPGHVIMAINDGNVDGHSHIDVLTRLVASKNEVTVYTCEPETAKAIRNTPALNNFPSTRPRTKSNNMRGHAVNATPAQSVINRNTGSSKLRANLVRHASITSTPDYRKISENEQLPNLKPTTSAKQPSQSRLSAGGTRMQRALSHSVLPAQTPSSLRLSASNTPNRPHQLLTLPSPSGGHHGSNLLSASLPQATLSHALSGAARQRGMHKQLMQKTPTSPTPTTLHPSKAESGKANGSSVSRRRSFHTMPSPLARTPSPMTAATSPTTSASNALLPAGSGTINVTASMPITPISPQRACSPLVQEPGGSLRMRSLSNRRVQSVYVPHTVSSSATSTMVPSDSSSTTSLATGDEDNSSWGGAQILERKSESSLTPIHSHLGTRRRVTTDDGVWRSSPSGDEKV